nr:capsid protein [Cressdnaviricota sp.]
MEEMSGWERFVQDQFPRFGKRKTKLQPLVGPDPLRLSFLDVEASIYCCSTFVYLLEQPQVPVALAGMSSYQAYLASKADAWRASRARREQAKLRGAPRRAKMLVFPDGSSGYGRYRRRYRRGRGGYWDDAFGWVGDKIGIGRDKGVGVGQQIWNTGVNALGSAVGGPMGGMAARYLSKAAGFGRYRRRYRRGRGAYGDDVTVEQNIPSIVNPSEPNAVTISHREFLGDVVSSTNFAIAYNIAINPGQALCMPWLAGIASHFEEYKLEGCIFKFVSTSGSLSSTQALGEIMMSVDYNSIDAALSNKQQLLTQVFSISKVPAFDAECPVETSPTQSHFGHSTRFVRTSYQPANTDIRLYDVGKFYLATQGQVNSGVTLGELWVTYQVSLFKPQLPLQSGLFSSLYYHSRATFTMGATAQTSTNWVITNTYNNSLPITSPGVLKFNFPATTVSERYVIYLTYTSTGVAAGSPQAQLTTFTGKGSNITLLAFFKENVGADQVQLIPPNGELFALNTAMVVETNFFIGLEAVVVSDTNPNQLVIAQIPLSVNSGNGIAMEIFISRSYVGAT